MAMKIKLDDQLVKHAQDHAVIGNRTVAKQIEHWARIGRVMEDNPGFSYEFIRDEPITAAEIEAGESEDYVRR
jgi:hypothetical protein